MADRGVKRNFDTVDPSSDSGDTTISNESTRNMREPAPSPTTASDSEPRFHPTTNDPTTGADMSRTAGPSNQATTSNVNPAPNANIGDPDANATTPRAAYHRRQAAAIVQRIVLEESVALTEQIAKTLAEHQLRQILRACIIRQASGFPQRAMIKYLIRRLAIMKMVDHPDFPEWFERFQRGEVDVESVVMVDHPDFPEWSERFQRGEIDVESGVEADDEMDEDDEDMGEAEEEMDTEETEEAGENVGEAGEEMDTETEEAGEEMGEEMDTES